MACQAQLLRWLDEIGVVVRYRHIVTAEARHAAAVKSAVDEVVRLHPILLRRAFRIVRECRLTEMVFLERPEVLELEANVISHWPIVMLARVGIARRAALRVALQAHIIRRDIVQPRRIDDRGLTRTRHVLAAGTVASLTADVPFGHLFGLDVVVGRMAAVSTRDRSDASNCRQAWTGSAAATIRCPVERDTSATFYW